MATASPTLGVIRAQIEAIRSKAPNAKVFGILSLGRWTGTSVQGEGNEQIAVYQCDSPLQMRLALQSAREEKSPTVLVTSLDEAKISDDILVRVAQRRFYPINSWEIVRSLFKARQLDPRITRHAFLADMLLDHAGIHDLPPVAGGLVDADTVWGILLTERLGLTGAHPDLFELVRSTAQNELARRWQACPTEFRAAAGEWISGPAGDAAGAILQCMETEHGTEVLAIGLVLGVICHETVGRELDKAAGRLETYVGTPNLSTEIARRWREAASICAGQLQKPVLRRCLDQAELILQNIGAAQHAWRSDELESGFEQRLSSFGRAVVGHVDVRAMSFSEGLLEQYQCVRKHRLGRESGRRLERVEMAIRLSRWLANQNASSAMKMSSLVDIAQEYVAEGGFVDWARQVLRGGEPNKDLAAAFVRLVDRVTELREAENRRFGKALLEHRAAGNPAAGLIPVELLLEHVVAKIAAKVPVLLLLVDGMNWAVFRELTSDIKSHDWIELAFGDATRRIVGLAALPSVTEVCRTSLLCGALKRGQAFDEVRGFTTHSALIGVSQTGLTPKLFHKAALEGDEDSSLAGDIREALADEKQRVVGIVINAVDDHLDKGDQVDAVWTTQHIRVLEPILAESCTAGRAVILLSDHGHILDRQTDCREISDGLRWRRPGGPVTNEELEVTSPRVVMPEGGKVIVPWSERLRYGPKKNGYHGGASPQEMLIPIAVLWPELTAPEGLDEALVDLPPWWTEPMRSPSVPPEVLKPRKPGKEKPAEPTLFDEPQIPQREPEAPWIAALLQCEVFAAQKRLAGRAPIDDSTVRRLIATLASRGGSMTAQALATGIGVPPHRLAGLLAIMQRLLNVEGYAILDRQDASDTVVLNVTLLKKQFEIDTA